MRLMHMANALLWLANALTWLLYAHSIPMFVATAGATIGSLAMWHLARYD
jgi:hypothetical protein